MVRDDFVDLINEEGSGSELPEDEGTLATVIKDDDLTIGDDFATVGEKKVIESESFVLKLFEKDGIVDSIEIECRCGRTARIQLEYKVPDIEGGEEVTKIVPDAEITDSKASITDIPSEPEFIDKSGESIADESKKTDNDQSGNVEKAETSPGELISNSDQSTDTDDTDEFQDGLQTTVISSQNEEEKPRIIEPVQKKPDDAETSQ